MPAITDPLPTDTETLRASIAAQAVELAAERRCREASEIELAAAKAGLMVKVLEVEKLKIQLARLRRMQFGRSSEKIDREIDQLELALEDLEAAEPLRVCRRPFGLSHAAMATSSAWA